MVVALCLNVSYIISERIHVDDDFVLLFLTKACIFCAGPKSVSVQQSKTPY